MKDKPNHISGHPNDHYSGLNDNESPGAHAGGDRICQVLGKG